MKKSPKYLCNLEKWSCEKKCIYKLKDDNGEVVSNQANTLGKFIHIIVNKLFSDKIVGYNSYKMNKEFLDNIDIPTLNAESMQSFEPTNLKKMYDSLIYMEQNTIPGYDEFPVVFWSDISDFLFYSYIFSIENGLISMYQRKEKANKSQRNGIITLLPNEYKDIMYNV